MVKSSIGIKEGWLHNSKEESRYEVFHLFQEYVGNKRNVLWLLERVLVKLQIPFVNRTRYSHIRFEGGPQWFCITHAFCEYVLSKEKWIYKTFNYSECCDEVFLQTLLVNSDFYSNIYMPGNDQYVQCCRLIDWKRGRPYIWRSNDFEEIMNSKAWFARKFSTSVDGGIVNKIYDTIKYLK